MKETVKNIVNRLTKFLNVGQAIHPVTDSREEFLDQVRQAHRDWQCAINNFNFSSDTDMIDFHICNVEAAERKYMCLLKRARKEKLAADMPCAGADLAAGFPQDCQ